MISDLMTLLENILVNGWVFFYIFTDNKKRSFGIPFFQGVQNPRGDFRNRSIIEREVKGWFWLNLGSKRLSVPKSDVGRMAQKDELTSNNTSCDD